MSLEYCRLKPFTYLNAERTPLYRALMGLFVQATAHFEIHLRPAEVLAGLQRLEEIGGEGIIEIESALGQLCDWGNLKRTQDTSEVSTVEEFYRPRYLYQLTREGEAAVPRRRQPTCRRQALEHFGGQELRPAAGCGSSWRSRSPTD